jgi:hypothetical protein
MNKAILVLIITIFSSSLIAQKFDLQVTGYTPIVYEIDSASAQVLFARAKDWALITYVNPSIPPTDVLEGKSFTINAYASRKMRYSMHNYDFEYHIYLEFKDDKYRLNFEVGDLFTSEGEKSFSEYTSFFKKDGSVKQSGQTAKTSLDIYFNALSDDLNKWMTETYKNLNEEKVIEEEEIKKVEW